MVLDSLHLFPDVVTAALGLHQEIEEEPMLECVALLGSLGVIVIAFHQDL